jgi:hypothetical protein
MTAVVLRTAIKETHCVLSVISCNPPIKADGLFSTQNIYVIKYVQPLIIITFSTTLKHTRVIRSIQQGFHGNTTITMRRMQESL